MFYRELIAVSLLTGLTSGAYAKVENLHTVIAPTCLLQKTDASYKTLSTKNSLSLITISAKGIEQLILAKNQRDKTPCGGFIDVTPEWQAFQADETKNPRIAKTDVFLQTYSGSNSSKKSPTNYSIRYEKQVNQLLATVNPEAMWASLATLTQFPDRYADSDNGVKAAAWFKSQIETMAKASGRTDVTTYYVATGKFNQYSYKQPSVVVKVGNSNEPGVVIGGHMDTLPSSRTSLKPGADDDGSGSVTVLETARNIISSKLQFKKPIYFVWYAAEEMGLVGSKYVVGDFLKKKIAVDAVLQFDMTGYAYKNDPTLWIITDHVNSKLTNYLESLIKTYVKQPIGHTSCGYACSDHASWDQKGIAAAFPFEATFHQYNPDIHTSGDKMENLSLAHMTDYAKLGVAFAVEMAEPVA